MKGDPEFVVLKYQQWLPTSLFERRILGAVVKEFPQPTEAYEPSSPLSPPALDYYDAESYPFVQGSFQDFSAKTQSSSSASASVSILKSIAGFRFRGSVSDDFDLKGKKIRWKRMQQVDLFWRALLEGNTTTATATSSSSASAFIAGQQPVVPDKKNKKKTSFETRVPRWINMTGMPVCLVVGIMICEDGVDLTVGGEQKRGYEGNVTVPVKQIAAGGAPLGVAESLVGGDNTGNPEVQASKEVSATQNFSGTTKTTTTEAGATGNSQIFALELRKVTTTWFRDELKLGKAPAVQGRLLGDDYDEAKKAKPAAGKVTIGDVVVEELTDEEMDAIDEYMS